MYSYVKYLHFNMCDVYTGKLEIWALPGIRSFSVILEAESTKSCVTNLENIVHAPNHGDNDPQQKMELVQCIKQNVRIIICSTEF